VPAERHCNFNKAAIQRPGYKLAQIFGHIGKVGPILPRRE
jgi:hypothetical protein